MGHISNILEITPFLEGFEVNKKVAVEGRCEISLKHSWISGRWRERRKGCLQSHCQGNSAGGGRCVCWYPTYLPSCETLTDTGWIFNTIVRLLHEFILGNVSVWTFSQVKWPCGFHTVSSQIVMLCAIALPAGPPIPTTGKADLAWSQSYLHLCRTVARGLRLFPCHCPTLSWLRLSVSFWAFWLRSLGLLILVFLSPQLSPDVPRSQSSQMFTTSTVFHTLDTITIWTKELVPMLLTIHLLF